MLRVAAMPCGPGSGIEHRRRYKRRHAAEAHE
jgi:hypothetical protein